MSSLYYTAVLTQLRQTIILRRAPLSVILLGIETICAGSSGAFDEREQDETREVVVDPSAGRRVGLHTRHADSGSYTGSGSHADADSGQHIPCENAIGHLACDDAFVCFATRFSNVTRFSNANRDGDLRCE